MPHTVKRGDAKTLQWNLGRDLSDVDTARVLIASHPGATAIIDRNAVIDDPATDGTIHVALAATDYGAGKLIARSQPYVVEIETLPGPLTHPDDAHRYERLFVVQDLG
jgi:hypothetical protein